MTLGSGSVISDMGFHQLSIILIYDAHSTIESRSVFQLA